MRILTAHNFYQLPGGEDVVFSHEAALLEAHGHTVTRFTEHNDRISAINSLALAMNTLWNRRTTQDLRDLIRKKRPDVAHFHNIFPLLSPAVYYACQGAGVPVIQTLHNPRLLCPAATLYRNGQTCEDCVGKSIQWPSVLHGCYHDSRAQTAAITMMLALHRALNTWNSEVDMYITATEFFKAMFVRSGLRRTKIVVKPHFVLADPGVRHERGEYALFVGRLAPEKGIPTLLKAWAMLPSIPLKIRGEGPMLSQIRSTAQAPGAIEIVPRRSRQEMLALMKTARFLIWPSEGYYETFGLVAIEAFACGVPVIASRIGAMAEVVTHGKTGLHFEPGNPQDLATTVEWAWTHPDETEAMGHNARAEYELRFTAEANYRELIAVYESVLSKRK